MDKIDLEYLCRIIGNLAGIPIRIYSDKTKTYYYSMVDFPVDPINPYIDNVLAIKEKVGYFITPYFNYYGIVRSERCTVVIGPSRQTPMSEKAMRALAFECDLLPGRAEEFILAMKSLVHMPLGSILQILCTMNYIMNGDKLSLEDISIFDFEQISIGNAIESERIEKNYEKIEEYSDREVHNTLALEQRLMQMITKGDVGALCEWLSYAPSVRGGIIANDALRQLKNTFIVTATLSSRAAIKGGLDAEESLTLSDDYIKKCELLSNVEQIVNLQYHMVLDYARRVEKVRIGKNPSKLLMQVTNYVNRNISKSLNVAQMAKSMFISRTHLAAKFKQETGITLTEFIMREKIEEAKRLLVYSEKSLTVIGQYLSFSSQSHFCKVFKQYTGRTPGEYRETHV